MDPVLAVKPWKNILKESTDLVIVAVSSAKLGDPDASRVLVKRSNENGVIDLLVIGELLVSLGEVVFEVLSV